MIFDFALGQQFDQTRFLLELLYAFIVVCLFSYAYYLVHKAHALTQHKGLYYLKQAFLFFILTYASRIIFHLTRLFLSFTELHIPGRVFSQVSLIVLSFLGLIAIIYLFYSQNYRRYKFTTVLFLTMILFTIIITIFLFTNNWWLFVLAQLIVLIALFFSSKKTIRYLYSLISVFWLTNIIIFISRRSLEIDLRITLQLLSLVILVLFLFRMRRWLQ